MGLKQTRRKALSSLGIWAAASPLVGAQTEVPKLMGEPPGRITPLGEVVNALEFEPMAQRKLSPPAYAAIAGSDRQPFEKIIFRPRRFVNPERLDLTVDLFGEKIYSPILIGPARHLQMFDSDGELAMVRGASAAQTPVVISDRSSQPIEKIVAEAKTSTWYQVYPQSDMASVLSNVQRAVKTGCKAVFITVGTPYQPMGSAGAPNPAKLVPEGNPQMSWAVVEQVRQAAKTPVVLKGIMSPDEARLAVDKGVDGSWSPITVDLICKVWRSRWKCSPR